MTKNFKNLFKILNFDLNIVQIKLFLADRKTYHKKNAHKGALDYLSFMLLSNVFNGFGIVN